MELEGLYLFSHNIMDYYDISFDIGLKLTKIDLHVCHECNISPLGIRRDVHLLLFMHRQLYNKESLTNSNYNTRLNTAPVYKLYKPKNEKAKQIYYIEVL